MLAVVAHFATGSAPEFRRGLLIVVAVAAVFVVAPVAMEQRGLVARVLAWPPLVWLGVISYGVYLWHWPIFLALNGERTGLTGLSLFAIRALATVTVAAMSWWLIEQPIRAGGRSTSRSCGSRRRRWRRRRWRRWSSCRSASSPATSVTTAPAYSPPLSSRRCPSRSAGPRSCAPGTRTVAVFGDSMAWTMMRYLPPTPGFKFIDFTTIGCGIARGGPYRSTGETLTQKPECETWPARWAQRISHARPDVVLLIIGRWETVDRVNEGHWTQSAIARSTDTSAANYGVRWTSSGRRARMWS